MTKEKKKKKKIFLKGLNYPNKNLIMDKKK